MVQIPTFENKNVSQRTSGVPFAIPNISDAATLPFRQLSNQADKLTGIASQFQKAEADQEVALDKLSKQEEIKKYQLNEKYKTDVFKLNEELASDFKQAQLTLNRKTKVKNAYNNILPLINEAKINILANQDTTTSQADWENTTKKIYNNAIKNMDDNVVKQLFTAKYNDLLAIENIDVGSNIRKIDVKNAVDAFNVEKTNLFNDYLNYKPGHPKRELAIKKLFGTDEPNIFIEAANDLILTELPHIAIDTAKRELFGLEATKMVDEDPKQFLKLLEQGYWDGRLDPQTLVKLKDPAINNARAMDIDTLVAFMPTDANMTLEVADELYKEAKTGNFGGNEELQEVYNELDAQGKSDFNKAINQQRSHVRAEISFQQTQEQRAEIEANDELFVDSYDKATNGTLTISDIDALEFEGKQGVEYKTALKNLVAKRESGTLPTDAGLQLYDKAFKMIMDGQITSLTDKAIAGSDGEMMSILDMTGADGIGHSQAKELYSLIINKNNQDVLYQKNIFQDFLNSYKDQILGNPLYQKFNTKSESRFFDFTLLMKEAYEQGIKEGKSPMQLLNSSSDDFILKNIAEFIPSDEQLTNELLESMGVNIPKGEGPPQKKPNQSVEDWLNSEEYKTWESSQ
tara:strand:+ start:175 stop:2064 length:1890 start_codon:yes stop_codon:yes gene_type:complete